MRLSAKQIDEALRELPQASDFYRNSIKIYIQEPLETIDTGNSLHQVCKRNHRYIEFEKSEDGSEWLLASMPEY